MDVASAHLTLASTADVGIVLACAREALHDDFHIEHATLQVEPAEPPGTCAEVGW
jgi:cobalt-zinc-cadmium efflux system protein